MFSKSLFILFLIFPALTFANDIGEWVFVSELPGFVRNMGCHDSTDCWVVMQSDGNQSHYLYKSSNQGKSWYEVYSLSAWDTEDPILLSSSNAVSPTKDFYFISFTQNEQDQVDLLKSTDGGITFNRISIMKDVGFKVRMQNPEVGFGNGLMVTTDGWETYEIRDVDEPFYNYGGEFYFIDTLSDGSMRLIQGNNWLIKRNIYTDEWEEISDFKNSVINGGPGSLLNFTFINENLGFGAGYKSTGQGDTDIDMVYKTTDGGKTFEIVLEEDVVTNRWGLQDIAFYDTKNGVAVGARGKVWMTNDGGVTWECYQCNGIPKVFRIGGDSIFGPFVMFVEWAGKTPIIGTRMNGNMYRYEGDFFKFVEEFESPVLIFPEEQSTTLSNSITFQWSKVEEIDNYIFQLSDTPEFENLVSDKEIADESINIAGLNSFTNYYWRVAAVKGDEKKWSPTFTFRTEMAVPVQFSPECGADSIKKSTALKWEEIPGAEFYKIRLAEKADFSDILESDEGLPMAEYMPQNLEYEKTYYWQVQPYNSEETGEWSEICSFTVEKNPSSVSETARGLRIYPNPADDKIVIESSSMITKVELIGIPGISYVFEVNGANAEINISDYSPGVYILKVELSGGHQVVEKVVVR